MRDGPCFKACHLSLDGLGWCRQNPKRCPVSQATCACRDSRLSQVLERGSGCPAALAVLHMELCRRLGLPLAAAILVRALFWTPLGRLSLVLGLPATPKVLDALVTLLIGGEACRGRDVDAAASTGWWWRAHLTWCIQQLPALMVCPFGQDKERYVVLWPEATPLAACGQRMVIDPYCGGHLLLLSEVRPATLIPNPKPRLRRGPAAAVRGVPHNPHSEIPIPNYGRDLRLLSEACPTSLVPFFRPKLRRGPAAAVCGVPTGLTGRTGALECSFAVAGGPDWHDSFSAGTCVRRRARAARRLLQDGLDTQHLKLQTIQAWACMP